MICGAAADWLAARRGELNGRFERAKRRSPQLDAASALREIATILPPLAGPEREAGDLLSSVFDLVLLHCARGTMSSAPGVRPLLTETFPRIRPLLLARAASLPAALSNAAENLGPRGPRFASLLPGLAPHAESASALLDAGAVLAWRLGDARLRETALALAPHLAPRLLLAAMDLSDWPGEAAPLAVEAARSRGWRPPAAALRDETLAALRGAPPERVETLRRQLADPAEPPIERWTVASRAGEFTGFGGTFDEPPVVPDGGARHRFFARCGGATFVVDADVFGWTCRRTGPVDLPVRDVGRGASLAARLARLVAADAGVRVAADGTIVSASGSVRLPDLEGASSFAVLPGALAVACADSHRIRIVAPPAEPL